MPSHFPCRGRSEAFLPAEDPVCRMRVEPEKAARVEVYRGQIYYFCAWGCGEQFRQAPERFLPQPSVG